MSGLNGTGPRGEGPMSGQAKGYCILKKDSNNPNAVEGFIGIDGKKISRSLKFSDRINKILKEVHMPGGDGTGPAGFGSMTGRRAGYCAGYPAPGYANPIAGGGFFGFGRGRGHFGGRGRGYRNWHYAAGLYGYNRGYPAWDGVADTHIPYSNFQPQMTSEQEIEILKNQAKYMQEDINNVNERIKELESKPADKKK